MRLLVQHARASINPCDERELDLRGYKIPMIENLGVSNRKHLLSASNRAGCFMISPVLGVADDPTHLAHLNNGYILNCHDCALYRRTGYSV